VFMKHELRHGHVTRNGHEYIDTANIKKYRTPTPLYIYKSFNLKIKIYTCLSKLRTYLIFLKKLLTRYNNI
jgi:hypothetical protein